MAAPKKSTAPNKWSQHVTETSNAMDLEPNVFTQTSAKKIAEDIEHDAEKSNRRKSTPYRSAMSMLTFYINRAGKNLSAKQRKVLEDAKDVLRAEFGPDAADSKKKTSTRKTSTSKRTTVKRSTAKQSSAKKSPRRKRSAG
jgi:hypothetical protein